MDHLERATRLMQKGFALLDERRYSEALEVGRELKKLRHSSAFEIQALAHLRSGSLAEAIAVLEEGVAKAGKVWMLWELLGNCYSDAERYADAEQTYQSALQIEQCDRAVVHLNRAMAFHRAGKHVEASAAMREVPLLPLERRLEAFRIRLLLALGEADSARQRAFALAQSRRELRSQDAKAGEAEVLLVCALALKSRQRDRCWAMRLAIRAIRAGNRSEEALSLLRELRHRRAGTPYIHRLRIHGVLDSSIEPGHSPPGFYRNFDVAAASEAAAFRYAKLFFPHSVRKSLSIDDARVLEDQSPEWEGVCYVSGHFCYPRDDSP